MRIVFMGTPQFAVPSLRRTATEHDVRCVYTAPDRPRGRGRQPAPSPVKSAALELGLAVVQPHTLRDTEQHEALQKLAPDVVCVAAYGLVLPPEILAIPPRGCINVHASLLPRHRGAAPIHRAILEGDDVTGVSIMHMEAGLDTGPVALTVPVPVGEKPVAQLTEELSRAGADALAAVLALIERDAVSWEPQDDSRATYAAKVTDEDLALSPSLTVPDVLRRVRTGTSSARAKLTIGQRSLDVLDAAPSEVRLAAGALRVYDGALLFGVADGSFAALTVRPAGKQTMDGGAFARGARLADGGTWGSST